MTLNTRDTRLNETNENQIMSTSKPKYKIHREKKDTQTTTTKKKGYFAGRHSTCNTKSKIDMVKKQKEKQYNSSREQREYSQWRTSSSTLSGETTTTTNIQSLPFNYCCLSLTPYHNPVCTKDGILFDNDSIVPFILQQQNQNQNQNQSQQQNQQSPSTIPNLSLNDLITLHMDQDDEENEDNDDDSIPKWKCPILDKRYTNFTKIVAIIVNDPSKKKSQNNSKEAYVYSYDAYYELNVKVKNYNDLTTGYTFNKNTDVIVLNDPSNIEFNQTRSNWINTNINKINKNIISTTSIDGENNNIKHSVSGTRILEKMKLKQENNLKEKQNKQEAIQKQKEEQDEKEKRLSKKRSFDESNNIDIETILLVSQRCSLTNIEVLKQDIGINSIVESQEQQNQSLFLTSTSTGKKTTTNQSDDNNNSVIATAKEIDDYQFNLIKQQLKKKYKNTGYTNTTTTGIPSSIVSATATNGKGYIEIAVSTLSNETITFVIELHCDIVPKTCTNFISLCLQNWYDNTTFHRLISNFMIQGGSHNPHKKKVKKINNNNNNNNNTNFDDNDTNNDNTNSSFKNDCSIWGTGIAFDDEFDKSLQHTTRGIIAMANTGSNTNLCQFYITFAPCQHLDNKHTIFGTVINTTTNSTALDKLEKIKTNTTTNEPIQPITIISTKVLHNPLSDICSSEYNRLQSIHNNRIQQKQQQQQQQQKKKTSTVTSVVAEPLQSSSITQKKQISSSTSSSSSIGRYL